MSTNISGNGATQYVSLRMNAGLVQYSTDQTNWFNIASTANWPVTITNTNPGTSSILRVVVTENLIISNAYGNTSGYFIAGSTYITFDGSGNTITTNNITLYPGFIQNGTNAANGFANVIVKNFTTEMTSSTLADYAGWLCQEYFGTGVSGNEITNCTNTGVVDGEGAGGIAGYGVGGGGGSATFTGCTNSGEISRFLAGGIAGTQAGENGSVTFMECTNSGIISGNRVGGIAGAQAGQSGSATFENCANSGNFTSTGSNAGGIAGTEAGVSNGSANFTNCTNSGAINGESSGGIAGLFVGYDSGSANFMGCTNSGAINAINAGGIAGKEAGSANSSVTFTNCFSTGDITSAAIFGGGIVASNAGLNNGLVTLTNCFSTGIISGQYSGGIAGWGFGFNSSINCIISGCYSTGAISGNNAGGIVGANVGFTNNVSITPNVNITNSYSLGAVSTTAGGICGGSEGTSAYAVEPTITITNCYSSGTIVDANSGLVAVSLTSPTSQINLTTPNTYVAGGIGSWSDANAKANLTGTPTSITINNPGSTWTTLGSNTPYILSAYNATLYSPSSAASSYNYTSDASVFGSTSGYTYTLVYTSQVGNVATAHVAVSKGTAPYYYSYNVNTFTLTNNNVSDDLITSLIISSNGVLYFTLPVACFLEGTKILCFENNEEVYRPIESIQKGDLVKTIYNGYMPVCMMGASRIYNPGNDYRVANRLYKCPKEKYPTLFEDLYITGCHSILVPWMTDDQWENTKAVNGHVYVTDNHFRLIACADEKAEPFNKEGFMNIYHIALDHDDICMNYGIYANGLLVETCSIEYLIKYSKLKILGEEDSSISEDVDNVSNNIMNQLVSTC